MAGSQMRVRKVFREIGVPSRVANSRSSGPRLREVICVGIGPDLRTLKSMSEAVTWAQTRVQSQRARRGPLLPSNKLFVVSRYSLVKCAISSPRANN